MRLRPGGIVRRTGANLARAGRRALAYGALPRRGGAWLLVRLSEPVEDLAPPRLPFGRPHLGLLDLLETLDRAAGDPRLAGVLLRLGGPLGGLSHALSLRRAVDRLRRRGVPVVAYADALGAESLLLGSGATKLWMPPSATVFLVGLRLEGYFLRGLLERLRVRPDLVRVGRHKSAGEYLTRDAMSQDEREQLEALADDLYDALVQGVAEGRGLTPPAVRERVDRGPYAAPAAVEAGLIDGCLYPDEVERELEGLAPETAHEKGDGRPLLLPAELYHSLRGSDPGWRPLLRDLPRLAYLVAHGPIHRGSGLRGIASESARRLIEQLRRDEGIRGVVLRIESPGGDGVASDLLWRSLSQLRGEKPVVVSMGDVVASGGYYVAAAADAIFAEASTLTGSIGVLGGKADLAGLYRHLGVSKDGVERGARAGLLSEARGFTAEERAALRDALDSLYGTFLERVAQGRGLEPRSVARAAQGRVWSGRRALELGLVDALGGPLEALAELRRRAGLAEGERHQVERYPRRPPLPPPGTLLRRLSGRGRLDAW